ncbi:ATP-binding protein [Treponema primitia]|uniref:ATP-binding protein n=1 Tax=Treponema primitia TaxID=88058 RepID=UPI0002555329|nr:ATP-binding protein [Treponema primitia]
METGEIKVKRPLDLLGHIGKIVSLSRKKGLGREFAADAKRHIRFVMDKLDLKPQEAVFFSHLLARFDEGFISLSELTESMKVSKIKILRYMDVLETLEKKRFITSRVIDEEQYNRGRHNHVIYRVPLEVVNAARKGEKVSLPVYRNLPADEFFMVLYSIIQKMGDELRLNPLLGEINSLFQQNDQLFFPKKIRDYPLDDCNFLLLVYFCCKMAVDEDEQLSLHEIENFFESMNTIPFVTKSELRNLKHGNSELFTLGLIENTGAAGFKERDQFTLTEKAKQELLGEVELTETRIIKKRDLIPADKITAKELFYHEQEAPQIRRLRELLEPLQFGAVRERLTEKGMRTGFACLFSGPPGTGKTETAYQLARETRRDIMIVDISRTKSMWFGESEKIIKNVFDRYRSAVETAKKHGEPEPILLFNEADGVIGKRRDLSSGNTAQTENAIQNIILQEMENLTGILIATTNLVQNLDRAFERRFLFKIEFAKPCLAARESIWQTMLPLLPPEDIRSLASGFDFSGGQIENIARKYSMEQVLTGREPSLEALVRFCTEEKMEKKENRIGFGVQQ